MGLSDFKKVHILRYISIYIRENDYLCYKEKMFIFDNLMQLNDRGFQRLVREVAQENLLTALKGVDEVLAERFFKNMSERAAEILREDMAASGPVKLADVEVAQKEIVRTAKKLADDGELMMGKASRDYV